MHGIETRNIKAIPIQVVRQKDWRQTVQACPKHQQNWIKAQGKTGMPGSVCCLPDGNGRVDRVLWVYEDDLWAGANLSKSLPMGTYKLCAFQVLDVDHFVFSWVCATYVFSRYKKIEAKHPTLIMPKNCHQSKVMAMIEATFMVRDLINTPACDMNPQHLEDFARDFAAKYTCQINAVTGEDLLKENFPLIYAVGKAGEVPPRLIDLTWGDPAHPKLCLVGKGITFDTGGLDLKPSAYMRHMKKDMGGAAHVLGLAHYIISQNLPIHLTVLLACAENNVSSNAMRPGDIYPSRAGKTVEIGNTDAEGRLVLADALTYAAEKKPDLIIDMATLTGAARVALGAEIGAFFTNKSTLVPAINKASHKTQDPLWQLPLFKPYAKMLEGNLADLDNDAGGTGYAGAITAALFLKAFIPDSQPWLHFDIMAWSATSQPGRTKGGQAQALRALACFLEGRYT